MAWFGFQRKIKVKSDYDITLFSIFSELSATERGLVEKKVRLFELKKGEVVYRKGELPSAFYLILSGRFRILKESGQVINHLHPGDYFGETSLLTNRPHSATIQALNDSIILKIEKEDFLSLIKEIPSLSLHISRTLGHRLTGTVDEKDLSSDSKILAFLHLRSKIGNSTLAANVASALACETNKKILFLDLSNLSDVKEKHFVFKHIPSFSLAEFSHAKSKAIDDLIVKDKASFHILKVTGNESEASLDKKMAHLLADLLSRYQFILVDLPAEMNTLTMRAVHQSDVAYFLIDESEVDSDVVCGVVKELKTVFGFTENQIRIVLRETDGKSIADNFILHPPEHNLPTFGILPRVPEIEEKTSENRTEYFEFDPNHRYGKVVRFLSREVSGRAVGLALGSGAAFGYAHVGVLKVFEEENIPIDIISASSIGAIIGGMWAAGLSVKELRSVLKTLDRKTTFFKLFGFSDLSFAHRGFFKGDQVVKFLRDHLGDITFRDLRVPLKIIATDLGTGFPVVFDEGSLLDAIRASISIPGIFRPLSYKGKYLIDGGVADPLPIQILSRYGARKIIAVNVLQAPEDHMQRLSIIQKKRERASELIEQKNFLARLMFERQKEFMNRQSANIFNVLMKTIQFMEYGMAEAAQKQADITLKPVVTDAHWAEFFEHEKFIQCGEEETRKHLNSIKKLIGEQ